jgi:hypothetical protein
MNPDTRLIVEELNRRFDELEMKTTEKFSELDDKLISKFCEYDDRWERKIGDLQIAHDARLDMLERVAASFEEWRPGVDGLVDDICLEVGKLSKFYERSVRERSPPLFPVGSPSAAAGASATTSPFPSPTGGGIPPHSQVLKIQSASERPSAPGMADRPSGHGFDNSYREDGFSSVTTVVHAPVKGAFRLPTPAPSPKPSKCVVPSFGYAARFANSAGSGGSGRLPKLNFPSFNGENPKLWLSRSIDYLEMYEVERHKWIKIATMHFLDPAARWLPSVEFKLNSCPWATFESMVLDIFGKDQHAILVRQLLHNK